MRLFCLIVMLVFLCAGPLDAQQSVGSKAACVGYGVVSSNIAFVYRQPVKAVVCVAKVPVAITRKVLKRTKRVLVNTAKCVKCRRQQRVRRRRNKC